MAGTEAAEGAQARIPPVTPCPFNGRIVGADCEAQTITVEGTFQEARVGADVQLAPGWMALDERERGVMEAWRAYFGQLADVLFPGGRALTSWTDLIERARTVMGNAAQPPPDSSAALREARRLLGEARGAMESGMHLLRFQHVPREEVIAVLRRGLVNSAPGKPAAGPTE